MSPCSTVSFFFGLKLGALIDTFSFQRNHHSLKSVTLKELGAKLLKNQLLFILFLHTNKKQCASPPRLIY